MSGLSPVLHLLETRFGLGAAEIEAIADDHGLSLALVEELLRLSLLEHDSLDRHGAKTMLARAIEEAIEKAAMPAQETRS